MVSKKTIHYIGKLLLSVMFSLSVFKNLTGGFAGSVELVKKLKFPLPFLSTLVATLIKAFGAYALITGHMEHIALPLLIGFMTLITILANNPITYPDKKWMFFSLIGVIGGLMVVYSETM